MSSPATKSQVTSPQFKRRFMIRLIAVLIGGMFLDGYILGILGPVFGNIESEPQHRCHLDRPRSPRAPCSAFVGSPLMGWATDKFGRKPMFLIDMALFVIASAAQFFVAGEGVAAALQLFIIRFLMGVAIGGEYAIGWPLLSEFSPPKIRGRLLGATVSAWYIGFMFAFIAGTVMNNAGLPWRVVIGSSTLLAVVIFVARLGLPESPSWLIGKGRRDEALAIARRYIQSAELHESITQEIDLRVIQLEQARVDAKKHAPASFATLFSSQYWRVTLFTAGFWFCAVTPFFAIATFADQVLAPYGIHSGGIGISALAAAGVIITVLLIDKLGRRILTVPTQWLCAVMLLVIGVWTDAPVVVIATLFFAFASSTADTTPSRRSTPRLYPSEVRGIGMGPSPPPSAGSVRRWAMFCTPVVDGEPGGRHLDDHRRGHRLRRRRAVPMARTGDQGQEPRRDRAGLLAPDSVHRCAAPGPRDGGPPGRCDRHRRRRARSQQ